jgi:Ecdysteroid kinase-like family
MPAVGVMRSAASEPSAEGVAVERLFNMPTLPLPATPEQLTPAALTDLIGELCAGARVAAVDIIETRGYGESNVSTSARASLKVRYTDDSPVDLPDRLLVKMSLGADSWCGQLHALYRNEVEFYTRLRPEIDIETPRALGGRFDPATNQYVLVLEDLSARGVQFPSIMDDFSLANVRSILDTLARLHARYWQSPRFETDLAWVQTHTAGDIEELMDGLIRAGIQSEIAKEKYKREFIGRMGTSEGELHAGVAAVKRHQSTLPQTLLHGDPHIGNVYVLPDGRGGLYDWQISVRGHALHDVCYHITTALPIEIRRTHERELLAFYRDRLSAYGVAQPPDPETLWLEYRRAAIWGVYIGWLTTPIVNYGWEVNILAHLRVTTAYEDHQTRQLVKKLS